MLFDYRTLMGRVHRTLAITWPHIVLYLNRGSAVAAQVDGNVVQPVMAS
jgi:hypothetical protein